MTWKSTALLGLCALLAACGQEPEANEAAAPETTAGNMMAGNMGEMPGNMMSNMGNMAMPVPSAPAKTAKGTGTITAIDQAAGTVTLDHGPIPDANWPAMTMTFKAKPEVLAGHAVGHKVAFDVELKDGSGEVTAITHPQ